MAEIVGYRTNRRGRRVPIYKRAETNDSSSGNSGSSGTPYNGEVKRTWHGRNGYRYSQYNAETGKWERTPAGLNFGTNQQSLSTVYREQQAAEERGEDPSKTVDSNANPVIQLSAGPLEDGRVDGSTKKWPSDVITEQTDYVFFQFGKYIPPFSQEANRGTDGGRDVYDQSIARMKVDENFPTILLPIPQDLANETQQGWQGKAFTGLGRAAIAALAGGNLNLAKDRVRDFTGNIKSIQDAITGAGLNLIPGVGGNLDQNDISGSARGVVLNPNAELLYDSPEMRELGMSFKMVPKNNAEAKIIREICQTFRKAAMPQWGGTNAEDGSTDAEKERAEKTRENFIRVPRICKFTFMKGGDPHEWVTQWKPCAISRVNVNYTPDGTYATYSDGSPVATELSLNFQETKLLFADEIQMQGVSF